MIIKFLKKIKHDIPLALISSPDSLCRFLQDSVTYDDFSIIDAVKTLANECMMSQYTVVLIVLVRNHVGDYKSLENNSL